MTREDYLKLCNEYDPERHELQYKDISKKGCWSKDSKQDPLHLSHSRWELKCMDYRLVEKTPEIPEGATIYIKNVSPVSIQPRSVCTYTRSDYGDSYYKKEIAYDQPQRPEWKPWRGGECPVGKDTDVFLILSNGCKRQGKAKEFQWKCSESFDNIIWYCVVFPFMLEGLPSVMMRTRYRWL